MAIVGWYYLHTNGELIYKPDYDDIAADIRESPFARSLWPVDSSDREGAWNILVEALSLGANTNRIKELAVKWGCTNEDAAHYAERIGCVLGYDGNQYTATKHNFINLQDSPCGFGSSSLEAMAELCKQLGFRGGKMWNVTFKDLLSDIEPLKTHTKLLQSCEKTITDIKAVGPLKTQENS